MATLAAAKSRDELLRAAEQVRELEAKQLAELLENLTPEELREHHAKTDTSASSLLSPRHW